jgi:hypothetical protein
MTLPHTNTHIMHSLSSCLGSATARPAQRREFEGKTLIRSAALIITSIALLCGCGFTPLHSEAYRASQAVDLSSIRVLAVGSTTENAIAVANNMDRRYSELLRAEIESQVNPTSLTSEKLYTLAITFNELDVASFVKPDGTASRGDLNYTSTYTIMRLSDSKPVTSGYISRVSTYNTSPSADYASYVSIEDARKRGILELAQDYKLRLAALLPTLNNPEAQAIKQPEPEATPPLQPMRSYETLRSR